MCLWNGFIAAAPGHPYLAKAIETVVNQVRNRFTSVDVHEKFCPTQETSFIKTDELFTSGSCLLGASINQVLRRKLQTQFEAGDLQVPSRGVDGGNEKLVNIPGRTVILHQNKKDMGARRFIVQDLNLIVVATDFPKSHDAGARGSSYSKTNVRGSIYGLEKVYQDQEQANEDILIKVIG
jgi:hypothetical protein